MSVKNSKVVTIFSLPMWIYLFAAFLLVSCINDFHEYPTDWAQRIDSTKPDICPDLSGSYYKFGQTDIDAVRHSDFNNCLVDHLLEEGGVINPYTQRPGESSPALRELINSTACIEISHPEPEILEIVLWSGRHDDKFILRREEFSSKNGDFRCDQNGLHLKTRYHYLTVIISNLLKSESRSLLKAQDGSLLIHYKVRTSGNHTFVPGSSAASYWIKWKDCDENPSE